METRHELLQDPVITIDSGQPWSAEFQTHTNVFDTQKESLETQTEVKLNRQGLSLCLLFLEYGFLQRGLLKNSGLFCS